MAFTHLKVGDRVERHHSGGYFMEMEVVEVKDNLLVCAAVKPGGLLFRGGWTFDIHTGAEEDMDLGWGRKYGITGTCLKLKE